MIVGIVGKPNCGKSTFFKACTLAEVEIANYPFTTIDKNEGFAFVRLDCVDKEFGVQCNPKHGYCVSHKRFVPFEVIDVAGLVPDAHLGKGRGNQFLDDLRQADALIHIVDVSGGTDEKGEVVSPGSYDPANDVRFLEVELDYWYQGILKKGWERFARQVQQEHLEIHKALAKQLSGLGVSEDMVSSSIKALGLSSSPASWSGDDLLKLATELRKKTKPMFIAANKIDVPGAFDNFERLKKEFPKHIIVPCSAESELALKEASKHSLVNYVPGENDFKIVNESSLNDKQLAALNFIRDGVLKKHGGTGVQGVLNGAVFDLLGYIAVYPVANNKLEDKDGNVLPDCFLVPRDISVLDFAFKIHTVIGKNFIRGIDLKSKMVVGKDHALKNGDVIEIVVNK